MLKNKRDSRHGQFGLLRDAPMLASRVYLPSILEKTCFCLISFSKKLGRRCKVGTGLPGSPSCCHFLCGLSRGSHLVHFTHILILVPVSGFSAQEGPPNEFFGTFFGRGFTPVRVQISNRSLLRTVLVQRQKREYKRSCRVRGMGLPQGPAFACTVTTPNKTKKQKLKKN